MRKSLIAWVTAAGVGMSAALGGAVAAPLDGAAILRSLESASPVEKARVFCYNKYNGRFLHWGYCYPTVPRVYCRNRYTGQFLYWGACRW